MKQDMLRIKLYKKESEKFQEKQESILKEEQRIHKMKEQLSSMQDADLDAQIKCHSRYDGHTKVIFINPKTKERLQEMPEGKYGTIKVVLNEKSERAIKLES